MIDDKDLLALPGGKGFPPPEVYQAIKLVVFDVDGVLTDGRIVLNADGIESKFFHARDGSGMTFLHLADLLLALITGRSSPVVDARARELHIPPSRVKQGAKVKLPVFRQLLSETGCSAAQTAFVGDDLIDLSVLELVGLACCPQDAHADVRRACHVIATRSGGRGGVRQICEHLLKQRVDGSWEKAIERYLGRSEMVAEADWSA
ncbi:MAG: HAD hydrolase family protein [Planctomycetota bacterium]